GSNRSHNGDVMVVQAMLHVIAHHHVSGPDPVNIGLNSMDEVPEPTGTIDRKTLRAILSYQAVHSLALLAVDGVIHPASYRLSPSGRQRNIRFGEGDRLMTITHMHFKMSRTTLSTPTAGYVTQVLNKFPRLRPLLLRQP